MMQIRIMGHAGAMAGIHGSSAVALVKFLQATKRKELVPVCEAFEVGKLNKEV